MDFVVKNIKESIASVSRSIGYVIIDAKENGEYNLVRKLAGNPFPRFHAYVKFLGSSKEGLNNFNFSLHLDQKAPVYKGSHAHSGEYFGPVVEDEADRIRKNLGS